MNDEGCSVTISCDPITYRWWCETCCVWWALTTDENRDDPPPKRCPVADAEVDLARDFALVQRELDHTRAQATMLRARITQLEALLSVEKQP